MKTELIPFVCMLKVAVATLCVVCMLFSLSCHTKNEVEQITSLTGTKWKLAGIADLRTGALEALEPKDCEGCYTLSFDTDTTAQGLSMANIVLLTKLNPVEIHCGTYVLECPDGDMCNRYCEALRSVKSYAFDKNGLKFFFDDNGHYLLFKKL
jgi:hypothetical protein